MPLYTDRLELREDDKTFVVKSVPIREIFEEALCSDEYEGVLINPNSDSYGVLKELLKLILAAADGLEDAEGEAG